MQILNKVASFLEEGSYPYKKESPPQSQPYLLVDLPLDEKKRKRQMKIKISPQYLLGGFFPSEDEGEETYLILSFQIALPFSFQNSAKEEVSDLCHFLNHETDFPGFCIDQLHNQIEFRHVMILQETSLDQTIFQSNFGLIMLLIDIYQEKIEQIALGHLSFEEFLNELIEENKDVK